MSDGMLHIDTIPAIQRSTLEAEALGERDAGGRRATAVVNRLRAEVTNQKARDSAMASGHADEAPSGAEANVGVDQSKSWPAGMLPW